MKRVVVILEHDGTGNGAVPIGAVELPEGNPANDWVVKDWLRRHGWSEAYQHGEHVWLKETRGLYAIKSRYAAIADSLPLEES
jgi:hypothetical protein